MFLQYKTLFTFLMKKGNWNFIRSLFFFKNARNLVLIVVLILESKVLYLFVPSASIPNGIVLTVSYRFGLTRVLKCFSRTVLERALCWHWEALTNTTTPFTSTLFDLKMSNIILWPQGDPFSVRVPVIVIEIRALIFCTKKYRWTFRWLQFAPK